MMSDDTGLYDFGSEFAKTYSEECECGKTIEVSTPNSADMEALIYVRCSCGRSIEFILPVI